MQNERVVILKMKMKQCSFPCNDTIDYIEDHIITLLESIIEIKTSLDKEIISLRNEYNILEQNNKSLKNQLENTQVIIKEAKKTYKKTIADVLKLNKALLNKEKEYHSTLKAYQSTISELKDKSAYLASLNKSCITMTIDSSLIATQMKKKINQLNQNGVEMFNNMIHSGLEREVSELRMENSEIKKLLIDFIEKSIQILYDNNKVNMSPFITVNRLRNLIEMKVDDSKEFLNKAINEIIDMQKDFFQWKEELIYFCNNNENDCIGYILMLFEYYKELNSNIVRSMKNLQIHRNNKEINNIDINIHTNNSNQTDIKHELKDINTKIPTNEHSKLVNYLCEKMRYAIRDVETLIKFFEGYDY